jgi:hypothetical protein
MAIDITSILVGSVTLSLAGCCSFAPCHPATAVVGSILDTSGSPVSAARVVLYGTNFTANSSGCFKGRLPDALPFTLVVAADRYKTVESPPKAGFHRLQVKLAPSGSAEQSQIEWSSITSTEYESSSCQ